MASKMLRPKNKKWVNCRIEEGLIGSLNKRKPGWIVKVYLDGHIGSATPPIQKVEFKNAADAIRFVQGRIDSDGKESGWESTVDFKVNIHNKTHYYR